MKKIIFNSLILISACYLASCNASTQQILSGTQQVLDAMLEQPVTEDEAGMGIKEALVNGITNGAQIAGKEDGYFKNPIIQIPFPEDAKMVEQKLRGIGLGNEVDKVILSLNRAAEDAAIESIPIFKNAIKQLTIQDAFNIVKGEKDAATQFLRRTTSPQLKAKFQPVIKSSLDKVNATKYWGDIMTNYNKIPFVKKVDPDIDNYVTQKAIDGLFVMVAKEELKIREDPIARTTELLKRVFSGDY